MKTYSEFIEESAAIRGALRLLKSASKAGRTTRTADGGRRVTSAARASRNATPRATMSRVETGDTFATVNQRREYASKINPKSKYYDSNYHKGYKRIVGLAPDSTVISGASPKNRNITTARSAAKKAGFKGGGAKNRVDYDDKGKYYTTYPEKKYANIEFKHPKHNTQVDTEINTIASGRKAAALSSGTKIPVPYSKPLGSVPRIPKRVPKTDTIVRKMKEYRRRVIQTGGQERNPVHTVDFIPRRHDFGIKGELDKYSMKVGRNFVQAQKNLPKELKKAGANPGDVVSGGPSPMRKGEDPKLGRDKRAQMYQRTFGKRVKGLDPTGRVRYMIGAAGDIK